jgi:P-type conjugative transfer protein TrbJ
MKYRRKNLAAKITLLVSLMTSQSVLTPAYAGIPVIDAANLTQTVMTAIESVSQTLMQIDQFATQLQQWDNMVQNTEVPGQYIWDQAMATMNQLRATIDTITYYKNTLGSIDNYLSSFKDLESYRNSPCFSLTGCSAAEWMAMAATDSLGAEAQKKSTDALFRGWMPNNKTSKTMHRHYNNFKVPLKAQPDTCKR